MGGWVDGWVGECMDGWMGRCVCECMNGWVGGWMDGWVADGGMKERVLAKECQK